MLIAQSCPTLRDPMDCRPPGSSVHGIFQARILEWVTIPFSRDSQPRDRTLVSCITDKTITQEHRAINWSLAFAVRARGGVRMESGGSFE